MKSRFTYLAFTLLLPFLSQSQNVGIGTATPLAQLSVGSSSQFRVNSTGNITRINNLPYSFPTVQAANQFLRTDGAGNLTWATLPAAAAAHVFTVTASGTSDYLIDATTDYVSGDNSDPTIVLCRGLTYQFNLNASGHPFWISASPQTGSFGTGVTGNGTQVGTLTFKVPMDAPGTLYYYCSNHETTMNGTITIL